MAEQIQRAFEAGREAAETPDVKNAFQAALDSLKSQVDDLPESTNGQPDVVPTTPDTPSEDGEPSYLTRIVPQIAIVKSGQYSEKQVEVDPGDGDIVTVRLKGHRIDPGDFDPHHHQMGQIQGNTLKYGAWMVDGDWVRDQGFEPQMELIGGKSELIIGVDKIVLKHDGNQIRQVDAVGGGTTRTIKFTPEALEVLVDERVVLGLENAYFNESAVMHLGLRANNAGGGPQDVVDEFQIAAFYFEEEAHEAENPGQDSGVSNPPAEQPGSSSGAPSGSEGSTSGLRVSLPTDRPHWLGGWTGNVKDYCRRVVEELSGKTALFISYNIPNRDNGNFSAGGLDGINAFENWAKDIAEGIGSAPAWVILEPDALGLLDGLSEQGKHERIECLKRAIKAFYTKPNIFVIVDGSTWVSPPVMADRFRQLGHFDAFSCNVSGYYKTIEVRAWADQTGEIADLDYIIDTSRNGFGNPHPPAWCNVTDTKIGDKPALVGEGRFLAKLWAKVPGESDGLKINGHDNDGKPNRTDIPGAGGEWPEFKKAIESGDWTEFHAKYNA